MNHKFLPARSGCQAGLPGRQHSPPGVCVRKIDTVEEDLLDPKIDEVVTTSSSRRTFSTSIFVFLPGRLARPAGWLARPAGWLARPAAGLADLRVYEAEFRKSIAS